MSLYPSLEDMNMDQMAKAQIKVSEQILNASEHLPAASGISPPFSLHPSQSGGHAYPMLGEYMGLEFTHDVIAANMPEYLLGNQIVVRQSSSIVPTVNNQQLVAPLSSSALNTVTKTAPTNAIRQLVLCKNAEGKIGIRVKEINKGIFVCLVMTHSPAALAGLRFGDQILEINGTVLAGFSTEKVHSLIKKCSVNDIRVAVRDRPFERTITLHKDSAGHVGFQFKDGEIVALIKDSSAARNGLLINHHLLEINGQNVIGLKDKEVSAIIADASSVITVTVTPTFVFKHMMKHMDSSLTKIMDHSLPIL